MTFYEVLQMGLIGVGAGVISASLGMGGGVVMVPAFITFVHGMDMHTAKGTSLFIIIFIALVNAWRLNRHAKQIPWRMALWLAAGSIFGSFAAAWLTTLLPGVVVGYLFLTLVLILAVRTFSIPSHAAHDIVRRQRFLPAASIGSLAGLAGGATGTGGGAVLVPLALHFGIAANHRVVALSNMVMVATSIAGSIAHFLASPIYEKSGTIGHVYLPIVPFIFLGAQLGSPIGVWINHHLTLQRRRIVLGLVLLLIGVRIYLRLGGWG